MTHTHHTPGPWRFQSGRGAVKRFHVQAAGGYQIACTPEISRCESEAAGQEANARLIAAAPDLLGALESILNLPVDDSGERIIPPGYLDDARSAIAKATNL